MLFPFWRSVFLTFGISSILLVIAQSFLKQYNIDFNVLFFGNVILCIVTLLSILLLANGLRSNNNTSFMLSFYGSVFIKLMLCAIIAFVYIYVSAKPNKPAILILMGFYFIYTFLETMELKKITTALKDAKRKSTL
jgi:ABC-type transport system involved in multi-copper enzyme maturation permease subunit